MNTRVKDLMDMALLCESGGLNALRTAEAIRLTFERRCTHEMPQALSAPPAEWQAPFDSMTGECGIKKSTTEAFFEVHRFIGQIKVQRQNV